MLSNGCPGLLHGRKGSHAAGDSHKVGFRKQSKVLDISPTSAQRGGGGGEMGVLHKASV